MIDRARLSGAVGQLDAGTRALLELSLRRAIPDEQVARMVGVAPASITPRRTDGIAQLADMLEVSGPSELAELLLAISQLPEEAWGIPQGKPFARPVSAARRGSALRRVALAASPLVAAAAVLAAIGVSSGADRGSGTGPLSLTASGSGAARPAAGAAAGKAGPGVSGSVALASKLRACHWGANHLNAHGGAARSQAQPTVAVPEHALLARRNAPAPRRVRVLFHPGPVVHPPPRHVTHPHHPLAKPRREPTQPHHTPAKPRRAPTQPHHTPAKPRRAPSPPHTPLGTPPVSVPQTPEGQGSGQPIEITTPATSPPPASSKPPKPPPPQLLIKPPPEPQTK